MKQVQLILIFVTTLCLTFSACKPDEGALRTFDDIINEGGGFPDPTVNETTTSTTTTDSLISGAVWVCTTETKDIMGKGGDQAGFPLFNPNAGIIFPGGLLQGNSLNQASPNPIAVKRAGGTISTDVLDGNIESAVTVSEIDKGSVTTAINTIIRNSTGIVPANFEFNYKSIQSREEFAMELGVDVETKFAELEANLNLDFSKKVNRYFVSLNQSYYTMSFNMPRSYDDIFAPDVTPADLAKYVGPDNPACYISEVTYGRIFYMVIESTSSQSEMDLAVSGSYNGVGTEVDADLAIEKMSKLKNLNISVFAFGGDAGQTFEAIGLTNIQDLRTVLGEAIDIGNGKALSYVVRSVYDNKIVSTQLATKYDVTNCIPGINDNAPVMSRHWAGLSSTLGVVGASFNTSGREMILINAKGDEYMISDVGKLEGPYPIANLGVGTMPFTAIGAACNLEGNEGSAQTIMLFDKSGTQYTYLIGGIGSNWRGANSIFDLAGGICPFNSVGVGAMTFLTKDLTNGPSSRYFYNIVGDKYTRYTNNPQGFTNPVSVPSNYPFNYVGASIGLFVGNDHIRYYFDKETAQYTVFGNIDGTGSKLHGPFLY